MPIVTVLNQKGGVGKTSTCHHLAGTLALAGHKILLVDNDPQASLTQGFWGPQKTLALAPERTIASVYQGQNPYLEKLVQPTGIAGIDLIPGSPAATRLNLSAPEEAPQELQESLRELLSEGADTYALVLIDCPPNLHLCSWAALLASDSLLVPLQPEDYGAQGLFAVQESYELIRQTANPGLELLGFVVSRIAARKTVHQLYEAKLRAAYGELVFATTIPDSVDFVEAIYRRLPVALHKPRGVAAKAIGRLAQELWERLDLARKEVA